LTLPQARALPRLTLSQEPSHGQHGQTRSTDAYADESSAGQRGDRWEGFVRYGETYIRGLRRAGIWVTRSMPRSERPPVVSDDLSDEAAWRINHKRSSRAGGRILGWT